jgi:hypothetical protein
MADRRGEGRGGLVAIDPGVGTGRHAEGDAPLRGEVAEAPRLCGEGRESRIALRDGATRRAPAAREDPKVRRLKAGSGLEEGREAKPRARGPDAVEGGVGGHREPAAERVHEEGLGAARIVQRGVVPLGPFDPVEAGHGRRADQLAVVPRE